MPPKVRITKEDIIQTAVELVRKSGEAGLNARTVAAELQCSTQPVFSNFSTMEQLRCAVLEAAEALFQSYMQREVASGKYPPYKASGMAYIRFAQEERELFKLLYMRDRAAEEVTKESATVHAMTAMVRQNTGIDQETANLFHLEMWVFVHGIAVLIATDYLTLDWELISRMLTDTYQGLKKRYEQEQ